MSAEDMKKELEAWVQERGFQVFKETKASIENLVQEATHRLERELKGVVEQAEIMESILPFNLIDIITGGGFVKGDVFTVPYPQATLDVTADHERVFQSENRPIRLTKGRYKVVLIVEKLEDEP